MTGRPHVTQTPSSPTLSRAISYLRLEETNSIEANAHEQTSNPRDDAKRLLAQVTDWLNEQKSRRGEKNNKRHESLQLDAVRNVTVQNTEPEPDLALEKLEKILANFSSSTSINVPAEPRSDTVRKKSYSSGNLRRGSIAKAYVRSALPPASSDTEWNGDDINVPHVEAYLDNSKTLAFTGGGAEDDETEATKQKDRKHWEQFKQNIVRLTHTLKVRGWRRIPIEKGDCIIVERLSGALTNAVYVVKPPKELPESDNTNSTRPYVSKSRPTELLLRIYGPQVEHLIDREAELGVLRRLARKKIGPRLLGYFTNGRFEEYLHARTLEARDIREPETSKQIAKRMRELHDGIELLPSEREGGSQAFNSWNKWIDRCEVVMTWLDTLVRREAEGHEPPSKRYTRRGFVCGVEWPVFKKAYQKYRKMLVAECGGENAIRRRLVFAHNDAQYGNLMRLNPPGDSPLLQPANKHRQLVVIDFEYAGANSPGYEFANHFSEWCYNYHGEKSYAFNPSRYPTPQEQRLFIRSYVMHRPQFTAAASATPEMRGREKTNVADFILDTRTPLGEPAMGYDEEEKAREEQVERDIKSLLLETRLWRMANAAFWITWGIVQANIPELDDPPKKSKTERIVSALERARDHLYAQSDPLDQDVKELQEASKHDRPETRSQEDAHNEGDNHSKEDGTEEEEVEEFDYLAYSQDRAMLFWGDCLQMGVVKKEDLPESLIKQIKWVKY